MKVTLEQNCVIAGVTFTTGQVIEVPDTATLMAGYKQAQRLKNRANIQRGTGLDESTIHASVSDMTALLLTRLQTFMQAVSVADNLETVKQAAQAFQVLLPPVETTHFPYQQDEEKAIQDFYSRMHTIANQLPT